MNHHVPGVAVQALRPAVVALKWMEATNCCYSAYKPYVGSLADDGYSQATSEPSKSKVISWIKKMCTLNIVHGLYCPVKISILSNSLCIPIFF